MLLLTIALATTLHETAEDDIESHLGQTPGARLKLRGFLGRELTRYLVDLDIILESEEIVVPFVALTNVEGFGAHD